jgi:hypothetical protein
MDDTALDDLVLEDINCCACGVRFGMSKPLYDARRRDNKYFYCPNGHAQYYGKPPKPRDEELEDLRADLATAKVELKETKESLGKALAAYDQIAESRRPLFRSHKLEL